MESSFNDQKLLEMLQGEKFLAFFDFAMNDDSFGGEKDGICKVARPSTSTLEYLSLTFIFDTLDDVRRNMAKRTVSKLTSETFAATIPQIYAITSVPGSMKQSDHYIHHIDLMFKGALPDDMQELIKKVVYVIRHTAGLETEVPQWWDENEAPAPSEAEKASWKDRIKAFLGLGKK